MIKYVLKRTGFACLAMLILLTLLFFLMQLIPGYPLEQGQRESIEDFQARLANLNLDKDPFTQFGLFWKNLFTEGKFGVNFQEQSKSVIDTFIEPVKWTLLIALPAFFISAILGILLGIVSAYYRGRWIDTLINIISVLFMSIPSFVMALYLIKAAGATGLPTNFIVPGSHGYTPGKMALSLIIPILSMVLTSTSTIVYFTRNEMVEVFRQEYMRTALAKGMKFRTVVFKHGLRNGFIPILYALLPSLLTVISGSIIIEQFFNVPGTAKLTVDAVQSKNYYIIMFSALFYTGIYFLAQIAFDIISTIIDPRIKLGEASSKSWFKQIKASISRKKNNGIKQPEANVNLNANLNVNLIESPVCEYVDPQIEASKNIQESIYLYETEPMFNKCGKPNVSNTDIKHYDSSMFNNVDIEKINQFDNISGKPSKQWMDILKRFMSNKWAVFFSVLLLIIFLLAIFVPIIGKGAEVPYSDYLTTLDIYLPPRFPGLPNQYVTSVVNETTFNALRTAGALKDGNFEVIAPGVYNVTYDPYLIPSLKDAYPVLGTDANGRDWWNVLWVSTAKSLLIAILVSALSTIIGAVYGAIAGYNAGKPIDTIMMRIVEILTGVPTTVWILVISVAFSKEGLSSLTVAVTLVLVTWIWPATSTRVFVMKYKDAEYIEASRTLGASDSRLIFRHLLPNISGKLMVRFVNQIPGTIFFETSLVFLGLVLPTGIGLGSMIEIGRQSGYFYLLVSPTVILVLITLCSQIIANAFNDALDPKVSGE